MARISAAPFWSAVAGAIVLAALPFWLVDVVPVLDYPAHFTRVSLLARGPLDPALARFWELDLALRPNLAVDLVVPALAPLIGVWAAMKLFVSSILALWIVGPVLIHRVVWGRFGWESLASAVFALNACFFVGFYNFLFGVGLAFLAVALWLIPTRRPLAVALAMAPLVLAVSVSHLMAFAVLALLLGAIELGRSLGPDRDRRGSLVRLGVALLPAVAVVVVTRETGGDPAMTFNLPANLAAPFLYASRLGAMVDPLPVAATAKSISPARITRAARGGASRRHAATARAPRIGAMRQ